MDVIVNSADHLLMLYKVALNFQSLEELVKRDQMKSQNCAVPSSGATF